MRSFLPAYDLQGVPTLDAALALLGGQAGGCRPLAGGTDLMVQLAAGTLTAQRFVSLWGLKELRFIDVAPDVITLGALTTFSDVLRHETLRVECPLLCRA